MSNLSNIHTRYVARVSILELLLVLLVCASVLAQDRPPTEILLKGAPHALHHAECEFNPTTDELQPYRDGGEMLGLVPGVTAGRMGGHGSEPVIRGQSQNQINIISDGSFSFGGCPNRMDPPSSMLDIHDPDKRVKVTRGYQSVLQGPGASGGTVEVESVPPLFDMQAPFKLSTFSSYDSNGNTRDFGANGDLSFRRGYIKTGGFWKDSDSYQDGSGDTVRSAFRTQGGRLEVGALPDSNSSIRILLSRNRTTDALYAGAGMDSPNSDASTIGINASRRSTSESFIKQISLNAYSSYVDHLMDNYSLRERTEGFMRAPSESNTHGGRILIHAFEIENPWKIGVDVLNNNRDARRYGNKSDRSRVTMLQSVLWPDVSINDVGLFVEKSVLLSEATTATIGLRYDYVDTSSDAANVRPEMPSMISMNGSGNSPNDLYQRYYGINAEDQQEDNVGGVAHLQHALAPNLLLFGGFSQAIRTADATERAIASEMGSELWVGNPEIDPETHQVFSAGLSYSTPSIATNLQIYYDKIEDYILRDRARGQAGILQQDGANIYRNIDAALAGTEAQVIWRIDQNLEVTGDLTYTRGTDLDRHRPLPQIPPLFGAIRTIYSKESWSIGSTIRFATEQYRVDTDKISGTGRDLRKTPGYGTLDLFASTEILDTLELRAGVTNLTDKTYANHLNRSNSFDPEEIQVNEPGRSYFAQVIARF
ncbi:MAG: TonB-dependent receptor [Bdellovibrionales bacterium]|nr:TonB-dependent receptor [Bdellovibrionales bacterium]